MTDLDAAEWQRRYEELLEHRQLLTVLLPQVRNASELAEAAQIVTAAVQTALRGEWCVLLTHDGRQVHASGYSGAPDEATVRDLQSEAAAGSSGTVPGPRWVSRSGESSRLVIPLVGDVPPTLFLVVGYPTATKVSQHALELAADFGRQAVLAYENARLALLLREQQAALDTACGLKTEFLAKVNHELRTPLNAVIGFSEALLAGIDGTLNEEQRESITYIHRGGVDLLQLVNDLLDLGKLEARQVDVCPVELGLSDLLPAVLETMRPLAAAKGLDLGLTINPALPPLCTDSRRLRQIVTNLVGNAIKFTARGQVWVTARPMDSGTWELSVADTGCGIPPNQLDVIFEEFIQVDGSSTRKEGGTGLGLPLTRKLAELLGGSVTVTSSVGTGSTFRVNLPIRYGDGMSVQARHNGGKVDG